MHIENFGDGLDSPDSDLGNPSSWWRSFLQLNAERSVVIGKRVRARKGHCYDNAWKAVERYCQNAAYVEGFAVCHDRLIIEHAWVEDAGEILDPTLPSGVVAYFPGLRFVGVEGLRRAQETPGISVAGCFLPIFYRYGFGGTNSRPFTEARIAAEKFAYGVCLSEAAYMRHLATRSDEAAEASSETIVVA